MFKRYKKMYEDFLTEKNEKERKAEFKKRLKYGKPRGRTRPPMRLTDDPGPS